MSACRCRITTRRPWPNSTKRWRFIRSFADHGLDVYVYLPRGPRSEPHGRHGISHRARPVIGRGAGATRDRTQYLCALESRRPRRSQAILPPTSAIRSSARPTLTFPRIERSRPRKGEIRAWAARNRPESDASRPATKDRPRARWGSEGRSSPGGLVRRSSSILTVEGSGHNRSTPVLASPSGRRFAGKRSSTRERATCLGLVQPRANCGDRSVLGAPRWRIPPDAVAPGLSRPLRVANT